MSESSSIPPRDTHTLTLRAPAAPDEWDRYFDLRWRVLRAPWDQLRGSERDNLERDSVHLALWDQDGVPLAVGRVHLNSATEAQVRFMAVEPPFSGRGLGGRILGALENRARELGAVIVVLNARAEAEPFYVRHGYARSGAADTLFGEILHFRMRKAL